ncbi:hypothetical protein [Microbacterium sp. H1-D42]|uniref:hypothetical protein n=1 Tax=Microbacterium sp. H1-D42 TaxID=2925844 RepID=UPI001F5394C0|nr:hypothetical protein [Microbacterium sp. H1-D42]UNK71113.1 hypothetical protein MNR00_01315 [Microbacterium sp. H1-D42]
MEHQRMRRRRRLARIAGTAGVTALFVAAIWIDLATGIWQQAVIISGIAAGLLTFLLTSLFFDRWTANAAHQRWYPVTHLALTDLLHALCDDERSMVSRGVAVPRSITTAETTDHDAVLIAISEARRSVTDALARWAGFLASSADVRRLMDHIARLALQLDVARDAVLAAESAPTDRAAHDSMTGALTAADRTMNDATAEIEQTLRALHARAD